MKDCRSELLNSVYSNSLTASENDGSLERIPYFSAINRIKELKKEEAHKIQETLMDLQQKLRFRDQDINILQKKNLSLKHEIANHLIYQEEQSGKIKILEDIIKDKEQEKKGVDVDFSNKEQILQKEIATLQV